MSDPVRLRDLPGDDGAFAKSLLRQADPSRALSTADVLRLQATVAKVAAAPASAGLLAGAAPYVLAALATVGAVVGVAASRPAPRRAPPATVAPAVARRPEPAPIPRVEPPRPVEEVAEPPPVTPASPAARPQRVRGVTARPVVTAPVVEAETPAPQEPTLSEELSVIRAARASLRADPGGALRTLTDAERAMPRGQLRDEREALAIEALVRVGRVDDARARLDAFARRAPNSPQGARLRALLRDAP